jgi:uncharacterized membrane protein YfcA
LGTELRIQWRIFLGLGGCIAVLGAVYWFVSYEDAGTTLLALAAGLALLCGGYLFVQDRKPAVVPAAHPEADPYLPHSSVWPFGIGFGFFLAANGLILGLAWTLPGAVLVATSVGGFVLQSRHRR